MKPRSLYACSLVALLVTAPPRLARAEAPAATAPGSSQARAEADRHFKRGLGLFDEDDFQGARIEFERAYQLAPNFHVLYNVGQVDFQLKDYVAALRAFERYLADGGSAVSRERRDEVERDVAKLRARIATVTISATPGAVVTVDGAVVGTAPLAGPIQVSEGRRTARATVPLHGPVEKILELAGGDSASVDLTAPEPDAKAALPEPSASPPWALWGLAGALVVGTSVTGVLALDASSAAKDIRANGGSFGDYQSDEQRMRTLSITTDVLGGVAIVVVGLATYFTLARGAAKTGSTAPVPHVALGSGRGGTALSFTF